KNAKGNQQISIESPTDKSQLNFSRQISLNHTLKGNKNLSIVIVERNSPSKRDLKTALKKNSLNIYMEDQKQDISDNQHKSNTIREEFDEELHHTIIKSKLFSNVNDDEEENSKTVSQIKKKK